MNSSKRTVRTGALAILAVAGALGCAHAQTLPAPPVSPAPVLSYEYDANGNRTKTIQAPGAPGYGFTTQNAYDSLSRLKTITDARTKPTALGYNGREDLTSVTDPRSLLTQYPRNGLGDVGQLVSPDTGTATLTYDAAGNLKTRTDSRGVLATYTYDALDRLSGVVFTQTGQTSRSVGWTYDQTGIGFSYGIGRLTTTTHPDGSATYGYDPQGRLTSEKQVVAAKAGANAAAVTLTVGYGYDAAGRVTTVTYPSGRVMSIGYSGGLPSTVGLAKDGASSASTLISGIQFDPFGAAKNWQWQLATGTQAHERILDAYGRIVRYRLGNVLRDITYDAADRITNYTHYDITTAAALPSLDQAFEYDELGRLTRVTTASISWSFGYDDNGNRTSVTLNGVTSSYGVSSTSNRLASTTNPARSLGYDAAGNTTSDTYSATYDLAGRLATLSKAGVTTTYTVDGLGKRVRKFSSTGSSSTVIFVYNQDGQLLGEYDGTGAAIREYGWLGGTPIAVFTPDPASASNPPLTYYIHADHLGAPRVVLDKSNNMRWRWLAEPFGNTVAETNPAGLGNFSFSLRLPGQLFDSESGLHYNFFRDYDSSIGRYTQSDPIGLQGGINTYAYVGGNPLSYVDPMGLIEGWTDPSGPPDMIMQRPSRPNPYNFRTPAYEAWMTKHARQRSIGRCAKYVRQGMEAGGANTSGHPTDAKDYNDTLIKNGFYPVPAKDYTPMPGDTIVFQPYPGGNPSGHIQTYNGKVWVSDFFQNQIYASQGYRGARYQIYRAPDCECEE